MARILLVDDDPLIRRWLMRELAGPEHDLYEAADGARAIDYLRDHELDVVLTDLRMAGHDGVDVLRVALAAEPCPAVILMSGHGSIEIAVEAIKIGAFDFVQKPFAIEL